MRFSAGESVCYNLVSCRDPHSIDMLATLSYVIITPARNEAQYIESTIQSMIAQTHLPLKWIIVSDGSTDQTDDIVRSYLADHPWIELVRMPDRDERHFAGKAYAFGAGYDRVQHLNFDIVGNLDGDVAFEAGHFEFLVRKMREAPQLGVAGAPFREGTYQYDYRFTNIENVWGGCQLFRRECFEAIGGYMPLKGGCIDHVAVVSARLHGWQTRTFTDKVCLHYRPMGTALQGGLKAKFKHGGKDYSVGNHPLWQLFRACYQMTYRPYVIGGVALGVGYAWSFFRRAEIPLSSELVALSRREQMQRLKRLFGGNKGLTIKKVVAASGVTTSADLHSCSRLEEKNGDYEVLSNEFRAGKSSSATVGRNR
jgi:poly-beta-1,6-N-acetyl-D-glucosamine synthase